MNHREIMIKRMEDIRLSLDDVYKREEAYIRAIHNKEHYKHLVYTVFKYYINLGTTFRDDKKIYYTMKEIEELLIDYYKNNICLI